MRHRRWIIVAIVAVFFAGACQSEPAEPIETTTTTTTSTTTTLPSTTTLAEPSIYAVPTDQEAFEWAKDAEEYAKEQAQPDPTGDARNDLFAVDEYEVLPAGTFPVRDYGVGMCEALVSGTEAQVEATMRGDLGIERWEAYGEAWFDSLVNGLCVRQS